MLPFEDLSDTRGSRPEHRPVTGAGPAGAAHPADDPLVFAALLRASQAVTAAEARARDAEVKARAAEERFVALEGRARRAEDGLRQLKHLLGRALAETTPGHEGDHE